MRATPGKGGMMQGRGQPMALAGRGAGRTGPLVPGQPGSGLAYTKQARNKDPLAAAGASPLDQPLTPSALAEMAPEQQKNALGERLFARISQTQPEYAAKITGMLLEMDVTETLNLLESPEVLNEKIHEALVVLKTHEGVVTE
jgi:polyadenylate-binding protein